MGGNGTGRRRTWAAATLATGMITLGALASCGSDSKSSTATELAMPSAASDEGYIAAAATEAPAATEAAPASDAPASVADGAADAAAIPLDAAPTDAAQTAPADTSSGAEAVVVQTIPGRSIIFEGTLTLETKNVAEAAGEISRIAIESGGTLFDSEMHVSDPQTAHASVTIKVPPANIGTAMEQIGTLGRLRDYNQDAQDITTQMVDLDARILTATASVDRVRGFLDQTRNVSELAGLEAELTVRETELEQLRAQQRALKDRVALATLTIDIVVPQVPVTTTMAPVPVTEEPLTAASSFAKSRHALWRVLVGIAIVLAAVAPFLAVFGVPLALAWYIVRRTRRRHAQRRVPQPSNQSDPAERVHEPV